MLGQISTRQLNEWRAYADLEPFDEERMDQRVGAIVYAIYATSRYKEHRKVPFKKCVPMFGEAIEAPEEAGPKNPEKARAQVMSALDMLVGMYGKKGAKKTGRKGSKP